MSWPHTTRSQKRSNSGTSTSSQARRAAAAETDARTKLQQLEQEIARHRRQLADLLVAVAEDRKPYVDGPDARISVSIIRAIYASVASGQPVRL